MYVERNARVEEGVAILSKFPIIKQDYIILSRDFTDKQDDHQRVVLHATISVPYLGPVHVYGTHLSLSEKARDRYFILSFIRSFIEQLWNYRGLLIHMVGMVSLCFVVI